LGIKDIDTVGSARSRGLRNGNVANCTLGKSKD
jgi:hypothetical protein